MGQSGNCTMQYRNDEDNCDPNQEWHPNKKSDDGPQCQTYNKN